APCSNRRKRLSPTWPRSARSCKGRISPRASFARPCERHGKTERAGARTRPESRVQAAGTRRPRKQWHRQSIRRRPAAKNGCAAKVAWQFRAKFRQARQNLARDEKRAAGNGQAAGERLRRRPGCPRTTLAVLVPALQGTERHEA